MLLEWLPFFGLLAAYDYLRGAVSVTADQAHVIPQIDFDQALFAGHVPTVWLQQHLWDAGHVHWYDYAVWGVYMTHFFAVWVTAAILWRFARERFRRYAATAVLLSLAPSPPTGPIRRSRRGWRARASSSRRSTASCPRCWGHLGVPTAQSTYENSDFVNTVAAMPSLHAAFPLMLLLFFWSAGRWCAARARPLHAGDGLHPRLRGRALRGRHRRRLGDGARRPRSGERGVPPSACPVQR